jgi:hypothetical protein
VTKTFKINPHLHSPDDVFPVDEEFRELFFAVAAEGKAAAAMMKVCIVGMARDIAGVLPVSLSRLESIGELFGQWSAVVVENDSKDETKEKLLAWEEKHLGKVIVDCRDLGRERLSGFEAARVERYAEYRTRYRDIALDHFGDAEFIIAVDLDPWGGWSEWGILNGIGWMDRLPKAGGMASLSLFEQEAPTTTGGTGSLLCHYDQWAWRGVGWAPRWERHFPLWLPPVGSPPVRCNSAFGALCIYRADPFFSHAPVSVDGDIEHVGLHRAMAGDGWEFYLNPAQRTLMHWIPRDDESMGTPS